MSSTYFTAEIAAVADATVVENELPGHARSSRHFTSHIEMYITGAWVNPWETIGDLRRFFIARSWARRTR